MDAQKRRSIRAVFVAFITFWALATTLPDIALPWHPLSSYGLFHKSGVVTRVTRGGPAAQAGIKVGDRIDLGATPIASRRHLYGAVYANSAMPGEPIDLSILRGERRQSVLLKSRTLARTPADNVTDVILILSQCAFVLIASWLVLVRPGVMTWAFYVYGISTMGLSTLLNANLSVPLFVAQFGIASFIGGLRSAAFALFILRFPNNATGGSRRVVEIALVPIALTLGVLGLYAGTTPTLFAYSTGDVNAFVAVADFLIYAVGAVAFVEAYLRARSSERQRFNWMLVGLVVGIGGSASFDLIRWLVPGAVSIPLYNLMYSLNVALPITLAYAVIRHRVFDVTFVISRAVVYATLTGITITLFAFIDWFFSQYLASAKVGTVVEIVVAIALGFSFETLHKRVDRIVDSVLFRQRHEAEQRLRRLARALPYVGTAQGVYDALLTQPADALDLASAALFVRNGATFVRAASRGWPNAGIVEFGEGDLLVAHLVSERRPLRLPEVGCHISLLADAAADPVVALPVFVRRELYAFVLYGAHRHAGDIDPDELAAVGNLAHGASSALDHLESQQLRRDAQEAQRRLELLRGTQATAEANVPVDGPLDLRGRATFEQLQRSSVQRRSRLHVVGVVLACLLAAVVVASDVPDLARPWLPAGTAGISIDNDDVVTAIAPRGAAARAGIAVGDRLDTSDFTTRMIWGWGAADVSSSPGQRIPVALLHHGQRRTATLVTDVQHRSLADAAFGFGASAAGIFMVLTALALVTLRPSTMTFGFFIFALALNPATNVKFVAALSAVGDLVYTGFLLLLLFAGNIGIVIFAVRFPANTVSRAGRVLQKVFAALLLPAGCAYFYYVAVFPLYGLTGGRIFSFLTVFNAVAAYVIAMTGFLDTYAHASLADRQRTKWVIVGFAIGVAGLIAQLVLSDVSLSALQIPAWLVGSAAFTSCVIPITVLYAVIHHRVVDVRFAVSRAVILGILATGLVALFSLIDWSFGKALAGSRLTSLVEIALAIVLGLWLNALHQRVDRAVDALMFRQRHKAEDRLASIALGLPHAHTRSTVDDAVVHEPVDAFNLTSAAVFARTENGDYVRRADVGWPAGTLRAFHADDLLLLRLKGTGEALRLSDVAAWSRNDPQGAARPVVAIPVLISNRVIAVALYGPHTSGADLDAEEVRSLEALIEGAATAYDRIEAEALRVRVSALTAELVAAGIAR